MSAALLVAPAAAPSQGHPSQIGNGGGDPFFGLTEENLARKDTEKGA